MAGERRRIPRRPRRRIEQTALLSWNYSFEQALANWIDTNGLRDRVEPEWGYR